MKKNNQVCVIDDDKVCAFLITKALQKSNKIDSISVYENGVLGIENLKSMISKKTLIPNIIFLDINMPIMDGWDFLDEINTIKELSHIPIFILSSSDRVEDIEKSKKYKNVKGYIVKPIRNEGFEKINMYL